MARLQIAAAIALALLAGAVLSGAFDKSVEDLQKMGPLKYFEGRRRGLADNNDGGRRQGKEKIGDPNK